MKTPRSIEIFAVSERPLTPGEISQFEELKAIREGSLKVGWLIESQDKLGAPVFFQLRPASNEWTADSCAALRFSRSEDASLFATRYLDETECEIVEHMWMQTPHGVDDARILSEMFGADEVNPS